MLIFTIIISHFKRISINSYMKVLGALFLCVSRILWAKGRLQLTYLALVNKWRKLQAADDKLTSYTYIDLSKLLTKLTILQDEMVWFFLFADKSFSYICKIASLALSIETTPLSHILLPQQCLKDQILIPYCLYYTSMILLTQFSLVCY